MNDATRQILAIPDLVAFWDFQDREFRDRGPGGFRLTPHGETPPLVEEGLFGRYSLPFAAEGHLPKHYLVAERERVPELNIAGANAQVTLVTWFKRHDSAYKSCEMIAGVWNEHQQRQYALFLNLGIRNKSGLPVTELSQQVAGHISTHGGATPGWAYSMDAAVGQTKVGFGEWCCAAVSYDGGEIRVHFNGRLDEHPPVREGFPFGSNPFPYPGGIHGGASDFTVGATQRPAQVVSDGAGGYRDVDSCVANPFVGLLGGLALFRRALNDEEQAQLATFLQR